MVNRERLVFSIGILRHFINGSLGIDRDAHDVTGFELAEPLLGAAAHNTYVETVSDKADTLHLRIKESLHGMTLHSYMDYMKRLSAKLEWKDNKNVILAFDYTDEDFYGETTGFHIHGWTGEHGIKGKFKFLTCSIVGRDGPEKVPLLSVPIPVGHYKSHTIAYCLDKIKPLVGGISLVLFDRGFYDKDLMHELSQQDYPYLIFVPKNNQVKCQLAAMKANERKKEVYDFEFSKNKTTVRGSTIQAFLKSIYSKSLEKSIDWAFATNVPDIDIDALIGTYKQRWNIETGFRVQDEARIRSKTTDMLVRYFLFVFEQVLQTQWACFYKSEAGFKQFIIEMHETCSSLVADPKWKKHGKA